MATVRSHGSGLAVSTAYQSAPSDDKCRTFEPSYLKYPPLRHSMHFACNSQGHFYICRGMTSCNRISNNNLYLHTGKLCF